MPPGKTWPWVEWEVEYINSKQTEYADRTDFFRRKGLNSQSAWSKRSKDWDQKRTVALRKAQEIALARNIEKRAKQIEKKMTLGDGLMALAGNAMTEKGKDGLPRLKIKSLKEAAEIIEKGAALVDSALSLDQTNEELIRGIRDLTIGVKIEESHDGRTIKILARAVANAKAGIRTGLQPALGDQPHPNG
jgi:hypothetical protein